MNDHNLCFYVRPLLERLAPERHELKTFDLHAHHRLALLAWDPNKEADPSAVRDMQEVLAVNQASRGSTQYAPPRFFEWNDLDSLLSRFMRRGALDVLQPPFRSIPADARLRTILTSRASGIVIAIALNHLTERPDLWNYFESGGDLPNAVRSELAQIPDIRILCRIAATIMMAPHAVPLPIELEPLLLHLKFSKEVSAILSEIPLDDVNLELVATRLLDSARHVGRSVEDWLPRKGDQAALAAAAKLRELVLQVPRTDYLETLRE